MTAWSLRREDVMPTKLFYELKEEKQKKIIGVAVSEFAAYGYVNSSTNRIVKNSGISKGSLFKYFVNKEDLYFFILDTVTAEFVASLGEKAIGLSRELFQRVLEYSALEFSWYIENPEKSKLIIGAFTKSDTEIYRKTTGRYGVKASDVYYKLLEDIDFSSFRWEKQKTIDILKWFLKGFNEDFLESVQIDNRSFEQLRDAYVRRLTGYLEILKSGLLK